ncbi:MAG TPA: hypothetical protein VFB31_02305 [Pseudolabrys sp.]|nr:hypothetical protein [Pseudolabrys sp.]
MSETPRSDRDGRPRSGLGAWLRTRQRRLLTILLLLAALVGAYVIGLENSRVDLANAKQLVLQLQAESQKFKEQIADQTSRLVSLQSTANRLNAKLNELMPAKDTYQIAANQSLIVANGRLTVGLIGSPTNQGIALNINGRQQMAASGDVVEVAVDPSTTCHVRVQGFDMFQARITATCP